MIKIIRIINVEKKLADRLIEECTENTEETWQVEKTTAKNEKKHKCSSCTVYIVLFFIILTINVGVGIYFVYYKYMTCNEKNVSKYDYTYQI